MRLHNLPWTTPIEATDPRMTGIGHWTLNAYWDSDYSGPVWGRWRLNVDGDEGVWKGTWGGYRRFSRDRVECLGFPPCWIAKLKMVGRGSGGMVEGLKAKAIETSRTFSPLPAPYENLCLKLFGGPCPLQDIPEGSVIGYIREPNPVKK